MAYFWRRVTGQVARDKEAILAVLGGSCILTEKEIGEELSKSGYKPADNGRLDNINYNKNTS